jgi:hypothetical protein
MMPRYLLVFACPVLLVVATAALLSVYFEPITGDLVRIGRWAERDFGGRAAQPVLAIKANGKGVTSPDVLVLGDSFSRGNLWQSVVSTQLNKKILSFHYDEQVGCLDNWLQFALDDPSAKTVVVETVERNFIGVFREKKPCQKVEPKPFELAPEAAIPIRTKWPPAVNLAYAFAAARNTLKMYFNANAPVHGKRVVNTPIKNACASFSNRRSDRMLYLKDDEIKLDWKHEDVIGAIAGIQRTQALFQAHGKKFILIVVPDKSTVYHDCLLGGDLATAKYENVTDKLIAAGINIPDLQRSFTANAGSFVDLYSPDDTHLSVSGFVFLASEIERFMTEGAGGKNNSLGLR